MEELSYIPAPPEQVLNRQETIEPAQQPVLKCALAPSTIQTALCQFTFNCEEKEEKEVPMPVEEEVPNKNALAPSVQSLVVQEEVIVP